jgi:hypothetical protein
VWNTNILENQFMRVSPNLGKTNEYLQDNLSNPIWALQISSHVIWLDQCPNYDMCLMNMLFKQYFEKFILVFMDDILVYSKSSMEHEEHL